MGDTYEQWICVQELGSGWAAVHMWVNREDVPGEAFVEPFDTGLSRYEHREQAEYAAKAWASAVGLPFVG